MKRGFLVLILLILPAAAQAAWHLDLSTDEPVRVFVDGSQVGLAVPGRSLRVDLQAGGLHDLSLQNLLGVTCYVGSVDVTDASDLEVAWKGGALEAGTSEPPRPSRQDRDQVAEDRTSASRTSGRDTLATAQAVTQTAAILMPASGVLGVASAAVGVAAGGTQLVRALQDGVPSSTPAPVQEDKPSSRYASHGAQDARGTGAMVNVPTSDAATRGMVPVTFSVPEGPALQVNIDGSQVVRLAIGEQTLLLTPGVHSVMIYDESASKMLFRGHLTLAVGARPRVALSTTSAPVCSVSGCWY